MDTMRAAERQQGGALLPASVGKQLSTKVPSSRGARIRPQATRSLVRQRSIKAVIEPPVLPFEKDAEHLSQWRPESWRQLKAHQQPNYPDQEKLRDAVETITRMPPLVFAGECRNLQARLAKCAAGEAFLLQGQHFHCASRTCARPLLLWLQGSTTPSSAPAAHTNLTFGISSIYPEEYI